MKLTTYLLPMPKLRTRGAVPQLLCYRSVNQKRLRTADVAARTMLLATVVMMIIVGGTAWGV